MWISNLKTAASNTKGEKNDKYLLCFIHIATLLKQHEQMQWQQSSVSWFWGVSRESCWTLMLLTLTHEHLLLRFAPLGPLVPGQCKNAISVLKRGAIVISDVLTWESQDHLSQTIVFTNYGHPSNSDCTEVTSCGIHLDWTSCPDPHHLMFYSQDNHPSPSPQLLDRMSCGCRPTGSALVSNSSHIHKER